MNIDRARNQLGYEPEFPMPAAIADYRDWIAGPGNQSGARLRQAYGASAESVHEVT